MVRMRPSTDLASARDTHYSQRDFVNDQQAVLANLEGEGGAADAGAEAGDDRAELPWSSNRDGELSTDPAHLADGGQASGWVVRKDVIENEDGKESGGKFVEVGNERRPC